MSQTTSDGRWGALNGGREPRIGRGRGRGSLNGIHHHSRANQSWNMLVNDGRWPKLWSV